MLDSMQLLSFDNLAQRVLYRYAFSFADFVPIESYTVSIEAQRSFYDFCASVVRGIADDPTLLGVSTEHPDEWLGAHECLNMRPGLQKVRNECLKAFNGIAGLLFAAGFCGELQNGQLVVRRSDLPKLTGKSLAIYLKLVAQYGLLSESQKDYLLFAYPKSPDALTAWKLLAETTLGSDNPNNNKDELWPRFILWFHNNDGTFFLNRIQKLLGLDDDFFEYISNKYLSSDYSAKLVVDQYRTSCVFIKNVGGLSIEYATLSPTVRFVNYTCIGIKAVLEHADEMDDDIKPQLIKFCNPCNNCMGCTKGGKNKLFAVSVHFKDKEHRLCPQFVQMAWYNNDISREKIDFMLALNELQERYGKNWRKK